MEKQRESVDAPGDELLVMRARKRKAELEAALADVVRGNKPERDDIERALLSVAQLLTDDLEHLPESTAAELHTWLERTKYLAGETPVIYSAD